MAKVISVHEYALKPGVSPQKFERALQHAEGRGLLSLPGLAVYYFVKGIRGARRGAYTAIWIYESLEAWERLWGPVDAPYPPKKYPQNWKVWEEEILAPFLDRDPDRIHYTSYLELERHPGTIDDLVSDE